MHLPPDPLTLPANRAAALLRTGRPAEAIAPLKEAVLREPSDVMLHHDLGLACLEAGRVPEAQAALQRAVALDPLYGDAWFRLGIALEAAGALGEAIAAYDRATALDPSLTEAWFRAGAAVYLLGHREEAIGCFRRAAQTGGGVRFGRLGKARALLTEDRNEEAERVLRHAVARDPGHAMAHDLLGHLLTEYGRFEEARACFERAIGLAPALAGSFYELARCRPVTEDDGLLAKMEAALQAPGLDGESRRRGHLARGKAADDLGDYTLAMLHFDAASREARPFDAEGFNRAIDGLIARWTPERLARAPELGSPDPRPILILGMPRSGTTLVEQIVSNHPEVAAGGELHFWNQRGAASFQANIEDAAFAPEAGAAYLRTLRAIAPKAARITDKMPFNFLWAGPIHMAFPRATILHCRRSAIDTALSIHQTYFNPTLPFPSGGMALVRYFGGYRRLADHWRGVLPADRWLDVDYEELTAAPEPVIRRIVAACGLPWRDACLRPETNPRAVRTPSKWQARQPIHRGSVARWRRYEGCLGPLAALLDRDW